jgi:hypothetical protein
MKPEHLILTRRAFLEVALVGAATPHLAFGQTATIGQEEETMTIRITFAGHDFMATLHDIASARDFASLLPLDLTIDDYATNEKIAYLPRKLTEEGSGPFANEAPGDLCYYAPWGNLAFFYDSYRFSRGLIRLGRIEGGVEPLLTKGEFPVRIELLP